MFGQNTALQSGQEKTGLRSFGDGLFSAHSVPRFAWWLEQTKTINTYARTAGTVSSSRVRLRRKAVSLCDFFYNWRNWSDVSKETNKGTLLVMDTVVEQSVMAVRVSAHFGPIKNALIRTFGCWHLEMSLPFTRGNETYRTCVNCGARRRFDLERWTMVGEFYRPQSRSDLSNGR